MEIKPKKPCIKGPAEMFTGDVWIDTIANGAEPSRPPGQPGPLPAPGPPGTRMPSARLCS